MENSLVVSYNIKIHLPYNPAIPLLYIYPKEMKTYVHTEAYSEKFITISCTLAKFGNHPLVNGKTNCGIST